jgi:uroporphyrinogen-III decarboxylase
MVAFLDDFIDAGVDIFNPVQTSAAGMEPVFLQEKYGKDLVFWGGGVDTQKVLPFGSPEDVREQVKERIELFGADGGFVFNTIHNIQPMIPIENLLALFEAVNTYRAIED